ncbi:MAG: MetQ/NlpA family ABC transporter substrate-binding protein [Culicoidibacterales bacterium]
MKKIITRIILALLLVILAACGGKTAQAKTIKVGLNGGNSAQWEYVKSEAAKEGINLELVYFTDYIQPNRALVDGELQLNAFQTVAFLKAFNKETNDAIIPIGTTVLAPMGIYSAKHKTLETLSDGGKVTVPNDPTNQGRALKVLDAAGVIKLKAGTGEIASVNDIAENKKNLEIIPMAANQLPPTLGDAQIAVINNGVAVDAGFTLKDAIFVESDLASAYINVIAAKTTQKDDAAYKRIVEIFQTDAVKDIIIRDTNGNSVPTFVPLTKIGF